MSRRFFCSRVVVVFSVTSAIAVSIPQGAGAVWFGAPDMTQPANAGFTCAGYPTPMGLWPLGTTSCTWFTISQFGNYNALQSNVVPKGIGFITAVRIRTGPRTGAMRLTIFKSLRSVATGAETACCVGKDQSEIFTPPADSLTTIPLARAIPVYNGPESTTIESFDSIAISLLDTNATIPANYSYTPTTYVTGAALYPLVSPGEERFGGATVPTGALATRYWQVLLQAEWEPSRAVTAAASSIRVRNGAALVPITCQLGENCSGTLRLQDIRPKGAIAATATYGTANFNIASGKRASIKIRLSSAGQKLIKKYRSRQVYANATLTIHSTRVVVSMRITLRR